MVRSDKNPLAEAGTTGANEGEEIDRIMKEIEDLEKRMDTTDEEPAAEGAKSAPAPVAKVEAEPSQHAEDDDEVESPLAPEPTAKVVPMRPNVHDSLAETDAVPARDEPLMRSESSPGEGGLALKIGGCTEVNLEFTRSGISVSLSCTNDALTITTDQGAEFRIPFKRTA
jgi:hypothetical protein